ncbi:hypothetical protein TRAPUB_6482 [Trametes pubescens]|uniref:Uncharacterized protein n=1 Tax=Trametes pubescens TaxID=154538 RepID=A0A1M2V5T4_TRAPU|nr:hypothetical protein TRAPUB_6482 [Trametes pubescens]
MPPRKKSKISHPAESDQVSGAVASSLTGLTRRRGFFVWYGKAAEQVRSINSDLSDAILHPTTFSKHFVVYDPTHDKNDESRNLVLQSHVDSVLKQYKDLGTPVSEKDMRTFTSKLKTDCGNRPNYSQWPKVMSVLQDRLNWARVYQTQDEYRNAICARLKALGAAIVAHCDQLPQTSGATCPPAPIDFAYTPECRTILDLPLSETVTADHFAAIVPNLVERWNTDVKKQLTLYLRRHIRPIPADVDPLVLAIAVFTCTDCSASSRYPAILDHWCLRRAMAKLPSAQDDPYSRVVMHPTMDAEWLARIANHRDTIVSDVPFDANRLKEGPAAGAAIEIMRRIVLALGLDAKRATIDELKACGGWLRCTQCEPGGSKELVRRTYDWAAAFEHAHKHFVEAPKKNKAKVKDIWQRVDHPEVLATVQSLKAYKDLSSERARWCCSSCPDFDADTSVMKAHLSTQHDIQDIHQAICDGTIYSHPSKARNEGYCIEIPLLMRTYGPGSDSQSESDDGDWP